MSDSAWGWRHLVNFLTPMPGTWAGEPQTAAECSIWHYWASLPTSVWSFSHSDFRVVGFIYGSSELETHILREWGGRGRWREGARQKLYCSLSFSLGVHTVSLLLSSVNLGSHKNLPRFKGRGHQLHSCWEKWKIYWGSCGIRYSYVYFLENTNPS